MSDEFILMNSLRRKENMYGPEEGGYVHGTNSSLLPLLCKRVFIAEEFGVCAPIHFSLLLYCTLNGSTDIGWSIKNVQNHMRLYGIPDIFYGPPDR